jgi:opacity protein-like surface antigen
MYKIKIALLAIALLTTTTLSQEEKKTTLSFSSGLSFPSQPSLFSNYWNMGLNFGAGIGYPLSPSVSLIGSFDYNNFGFNDKALLSDLGYGGYGITVTGSSITIITVLSNLKVTLVPETKSVSPYLLAGMGFLSISSSDVSVSLGSYSRSASGNSESAFALQFGTGMDIPINEKIKVFLQASYGVGLTKGTSTNYLPLKAGVSFTL